jgi:hypothetical protein
LLIFQRLVNRIRFFLGFLHKQSISLSLDQGMIVMNRSVNIRYLLVLIGLLLILVMTGCYSSSNPLPVTTHTSSPSPWPPPPRLGTGVVIGKVAPPSQTGFHFSAQDLYLGKLLPAMQPNAKPAISFTFGVDSGTTVHNPDGTFAFTDVVPDTYVLIIWTPENSFVIDSPEGGFIKVIVEMDKITDLGDVVLP